MNGHEAPSGSETHADEPINPLEKGVKERIVDFFKSLGEWRDRILVIAGAFYVVGYAFWSINARANNLGLLPALQFQYIVAGFVPVLVVAGAIAAWWFLRFITNLWLRNLNENSTKPWGIIRGGIKVIVFIAVGGFIYALSPTFTLVYMLGGGLYQLIVHKEYLPLMQGLAKKLQLVSFDELSTSKRIIRSLLELGFVIIAVVFLLNYKTIDQVVFSVLLRILPQGEVMLGISYLLAVLLIFGGTTVFPEFLTSFYREFYTVLILLVLTTVTLLAYYEGVYTQLPQEFGGVKPRCAYLDIKTDNLSNETRDAILAPVELNTETILRSIELEVLFTGSNFVMVRARQPLTGTGRLVYEIPRSNIQAITWCE